MRFAMLLVALPAFGQFRSMELTFEGMGCASCIESMPARMKRMRGVESATVEGNVLKISLAGQNRVKIEQVRDAIEQDGTKAKRASVVVKGDLIREGDQWLLRTPGASYKVEYAGALSEGAHLVRGEIAGMRTIVIALTTTPEKQ